MAQYKQREDGEGWSIRNREAFRLACCDCGLVHDLVVISPGKRRGAALGIAARRNKRATAQKRRTRHPFKRAANGR